MLWRIILTQLGQFHEWRLHDQATGKRAIYTAFSLFQWQIHLLIIIKLIQL